MALEIWRPRSRVAAWQPMKELEDMERRFSDVFGSWPTLWSHGDGEKAWLPSVDVFEKDGNLVIKAELPGMKQEDIDVSVEGDMLNIKGEKKTEKEVKEENYYQSECSYGSFLRSIPIPSTVDASKVAAEYEDGVLQVTLPKLAGEKPKKISVTAKKKTAAK
jgi:HSP20 family protein